RGVNPIGLMAAFLGEVERIPRRTHPDLVGATISPLSVEGHGNFPQTPDRCVAILDYRPLPDDDIGTMERHLSEIAGRVAGRDPRASGTVHLLRSMYPFGAAPDAPIVTALLESIREETG